MPLLRPFGKLGDIVYSLCIARGLSQLLGRPLPIGMTPMERNDWQITYADCEWTRSLSRACHEYVADFRILNRDDLAAHENVIDFEVWFDLYRDPETTCVFTSQLRFLSEEHGLEVTPPSLIGPWLDVPPREEIRVLINRTGRYPGGNPSLIWREMLNRHPDNGRQFLGLTHEYNAFVDMMGIGPMPRIQAEDLYEMARIVRSARVLLCNQSLALALAHGLGIPVCVETSPQYPDCIIERPGADYVNIDATRQGIAFRW